MTMRAALAAICLTLGALLAPAANAAPEFPPLTGRVTDAADIIPQDVESRLDGKLAALEQNTRRQFVIATLPSLQGYEISDFGYQLGRAWGIGDKERNDGLLLIVAPNERKVRIEVGYGLEPVVTDGFSSDVINQQIVPRFKAGDMPGGIEAGADALIQQLQLPPEEAQKIAAEAGKAPEGNAVGPLIFMLFIALFFGWPILAAMLGFQALRHGRGSRTWSSGGWSSGSSWGGGGGFSGGGGSFGGGGSSGSW